MTTGGGCMCGAVRYEFDGEPLWVAHCHCESCRRHTSSAVATFVGVRAEHFRYTQGAAKVFDSSPGVRRSFCATCGSPLTYTAERWPGEIHIYLGTLDNPSNFPASVHVYADEQLAWFEIADHAPRYATTGKAGKPVRVGPRKAD